MIQLSNLSKSALFTAAIVSVSIISWELFLRNRGFETFYNDDPALWTNIRHEVYEPADKTTVFTGSSRIKFDLDIDTWERITGDHAVQLACVGSTPVPVLDNLANDKNFKGKVVVDVTEGLFFSVAGSDRRPKENLKYFKEETPSQWASFHINHLLESQFVFLDKEWLSLGAQLEQLPLRDRPGIMNFKGFPSDFGRVKFNRQEYMTNKFASDTTLRNIVKNIWSGFGRANTEPSVEGAVLDSIFNAVKGMVDKIKSRGGQVLFVRTPSSGDYLMAEKMGYPREKYWDKLLTITNCPGIHFTDYPSLKDFVCPENSHLSLSQAKDFTVSFIEILKEKGWKFPNGISQ